MDTSVKHPSFALRNLRRWGVRGLDFMALSAIAFLLVLHFMAQEPQAGATRPAYDRYMREFVLEHNIVDLRKEAIDARLEFRNAEWENTRRAKATVWIAGSIFLYGFWRLLIYKS